MSEWVLPLAVGAATGVLSGFGVGGGTLLLVYMTAFAGVDQHLAQGINLLYFIPTAAASLLLHSKHHQVEWKAVLPAALCGCATAAGFSLLSLGLELGLLKKLFGVFLIFTGLSELRKKPSSTSVR